MTALVFDARTVAPLVPPTCPKCGEPASLRPQGGQVHAICCGQRVSRGSRQQFLKARDAAHKAFDPLWQSGLIPRSYAYVLLAFELGVSEPEAHMSKMDLALARRVPDAVQRIRATYNRSRRHARS